MAYLAILALLVALSPFTALGIWDRRKKILAKVNEWTKPKKEPTKEPAKEPAP